MKSQALYPYHDQVAEFARNKDRCGLFVFYGGGKTYLSLRNLEEGQAQAPVLVVCPKKLIVQWGKQIEQHSNFSYCLLEGSSNERVGDLLRYGGKADICVVNYDATRNRGVAARLKNMRFRTIIADESTRLKEKRTERFKAWYKIAKHAKYRMILTGRPATEDLEELWSQMLFLDDGDTLGSAFWSYRTRYFQPNPAGWPPVWTPKEGAAEEIAGLLSKNCILVPKSTVANQLPPQVVIPIYLELPTAVRRIYNELRKEFATTWPSGDAFDTQWAMVRTAKLHQLATGIVYKTSATGDRDFEVVHTEKLDWLKEELPDILRTGPTLIWTENVKAAFAISLTLSEIGITNNVYHGDLRAKQANAVIESFQLGAVDALVLTEQAGNEGHNLQRACNAVFVSYEYSAGKLANAMNRCHRLGSEIHSSVNYFFLIMKDTVDEVVLASIKGKDEVVNALYRHIKSV